LLIVIARFGYLGTRGQQLSHYVLHEQLRELVRGGA
jgi:hypothetical protein